MKLFDSGNRTEYPKLEGVSKDEVQLLQTSAVNFGNTLRIRFEHYIGINMFFKLIVTPFIKGTPYQRNYFFLFSTSSL